MNVEACIFDLDGTLLDTLPDLVLLTNTVLRQNGMPERTTEEINSFVGGGARLLLQRAAVAGLPDDALDDLLAQWKSLYPECGHKLTHPYDGIPAVLDYLKARGVKLGVLSNKFHAATCEVIATHFPGVFDCVWGERPETPRKPDPQGLLAMVSALDVQPRHVVYVGDSGTDMEVAVRAGAIPLGVTWGYRSRAELEQAGARFLADSPSQILDALSISDGAAM